MAQHPAIAIIGGGPGGLTLANVLHRRGVASAVFEVDAHPLARPQGGTLDLHGETGQRALRLAGLETSFRRFARYEDQGMKLFAPDGRLLHEDPDPSGGARPETDRTQLRALLLEALPDSVVRWGQKVEAVRPLGDGRYRVIANGAASEPFDLVVGADGAWSNVRPLVSPAIPASSGVTLVELGVDDADLRHPELSSLVGHGKLFAIGSNRILVAQRSSQSHIRVYVAVRNDESPSPFAGVELAQAVNARSANSRGGRPSGWRWSRPRSRSRYGGSMRCPSTIAGPTARA